MYNKILDFFDKLFNEKPELIEKFVKFNDEEVYEFSKEHGAKFTLEELKNYVKQLDISNNPKELNTEDLDMVSGGTNSSVKNKLLSTAMATICALPVLSAKPKAIAMDTTHPPVRQNIFSKTVSDITSGAFIVYNLVTQKLSQTKFDSHVPENINTNDEINTRIVGLGNIGNSCYLNSLLQILQLDKKLYNNLETYISQNINHKTRFLYNILGTMNAGLPDKNAYNVFAREVEHTGSQRCVSEVLEILDKKLDLKNDLPEINQVLPGMTNIQDADIRAQNNASSCIYFINRSAESNTKDKTPVEIPNEVQTKDGKKLYLQGYILHRGSSSNSGHYTAVKIKNGKYYYCNDNYVTDATENELPSSNNVKQNIALAYYQENL